MDVVKLKEMIVNHPLQAASMMASLFFPSCKSLQVTQAKARLIEELHLGKIE